MSLPRRLQAIRAKRDEARYLLELVDSLVTTVRDHDDYTGGHSCRVSDFAMALARIRGLPVDEVALMGQAGLVHDIGKVGIPDHILNKSGPLTDEEFELIRLHPALGASIVGRMPRLQPLVPIVLHHHERWDGKGYPAGLAGEEIPFGARVVFVADAFDAMTTERPYGRVLSEQEALEELERCAGDQFDPHLVADMRHAHREGLLEPWPSQSEPSDPSIPIIG